LNLATSHSAAVPLKSLTQPPLTNNPSSLPEVQALRDAEDRNSEAITTLSPRTARQPGRGGGEGEREFMRSASDTGRQDTHTSIGEGGEFRV
jgi:hypothetical protein